MIYFTYKLFQMGDGGHSIVRGMTPAGLIVGTSISNGLFLGVSDKPIAKVFSQELIDQHEAKEIKQEEAIALLEASGMNDPQPDENGKLVDANPPYTEKRGIKYVEALEVEVIKTKPELVKGAI